MTPNPKAILAAVAAFFVGVCLIWAGWNAWQTHRGAAAQGRVERNQTRAAQDSAHDAIGAVAASGARDAASEDLTRTNEKDIRHAEGANDAVNPALRDAGLAGLCRRSSLKNDPKCLRFTHSR